MASSSSLYAVILAGGSGTRFWPISRHALPKHLLPLFEGETLIEKTFDRLAHWMPKENILVLTSVSQRPLIREMLQSRGMLAANVLAEPAKRDTAPAVALAVGAVKARDPKATMMILPADHLVEDVDAFSKTLSAAVQAAQSTEGLLTIGIKPSWACPGYGYIEQGEQVRPEGYENDAELKEVARFREKPDRATAETFLQAGNFSWNAGMFIWTLDAVQAELTAHCPELAAFVNRLSEAKSLEAVVEREFAGLTATSIDYALMEKSGKVYNIEAAFDWDDVGSWISMARYLPCDEAGNAANSALGQIDSSGNIVFSSSGKTVALLGVEGLIVVESEDALMVASKTEAEKIKALVNEVSADLH